MGFPRSLHRPFELVQRADTDGCVLGQRKLLQHAGDIRGRDSLIGGNDLLYGPVVAALDPIATD